MKRSSYRILFLFNKDKNDCTSVFKIFNKCVAIKNENGRNIISRLKAQRTPILVIQFVNIRWVNQSYNPEKEDSGTCKSFSPSKLKPGISFF